MTALGIVAAVLVALAVILYVAIRVAKLGINYEWQEDRQRYRVYWQSLWTRTEGGILRAVTPQRAKQLRLKADAYQLGPVAYVDPHGKEVAVLNGWEKGKMFVRYLYLRRISPARAEQMRQDVFGHTLKPLRAAYQLKAGRPP